jgi:TnpA family transposase
MNQAPNKNIQEHIDGRDGKSDLIHLEQKQIKPKLKAIRTAVFAVILEKKNSETSGIKPILEILSNINNAESLEQIAAIAEQHSILISFSNE